LNVSATLYPPPSKTDNQQSRPTTFNLGYPVLCHWLALGMVALMLLIAAIYDFIPLLVLSILLLVLAGVSRLWSWQSLRQMSSQMTINQSRVFPGESIDLALGVTNRKWLPLPWLSIEVELPYKLVKGLSAPSPYARERRRWTTAIWGGQRVGWKHRLQCQARGDYRLGPVRLRSGDVFGLFPRETIQAQWAHLLVYPRIVPVDKLKPPLRALSGDRSTSRNIYEDTSRTIGTREYRHDDPFKRIHWKASARGAQLQARQYESTTSLSLFIALDVGSFCLPEPDEEAFELAVTTVASLAYAAHGEKSAFGLMANAVLEIQIPLSSARNQLVLILESLARIQPASRILFTDQLRHQQASLPIGTTIVMVTRRLSSSVTGMAQKLEHEGHSVMLISIGETVPAGDLGGIPAISILSLGDLSRKYGEARA